MNGDPVIEEIRGIRRQISEECGHDPRRLADRYRKKQADYADRLWRGRKFERRHTNKEEG